VTETAEPTATAKPKRPRSKRADPKSAATPPATAVPTTPLPTLRILETRVLRGPNYWAREPVIRMLVDLGNLEEFPSNRIPGFTDALVALLPTLEDHACSLGRRGGFITRLQEGTWAGHIA
jgi:cyanophycin synthetase